MERRTVVDQIEVKRDGIVQVRLAKQVVDGEQMLRNDYHRMEPLTPGADLESALLIVNAHLTELREAMVEEAEWDRVRRVVAMEHTAEAIAAYEAKRAAAETPQP